MTTPRVPLDPASSESRAAHLYNAKWRRVLLLALPVGVFAFVAAKALEGPSGQTTALDAVLYPAMAAALIACEVLLLLRPDALRFVVLSLTAGMSVFFVAKLAAILFLFPADANLHAEMTENFFWIPVIYLLSFILPDVRLSQRFTLGFTIAVFALGIAYSVPHAIGDRSWGVVYALVQMNLANAVFFALTSAFTAFKEEYTRTQTRVEAAERFASTDLLTSLPNRRSLHQHLGDRLARAEEEGTKLALLFIDVDSFKVVNDSLGHAGGDLLLRQVAKRLRSATRTGDFIARISGDEFVLVVDGPEAHQAATLVAQRATAALLEPFHIQGHPVRVSVSIGISLYPDDAGDADTLLRHADSAMYRVKRSGRNGIRHFLGEEGGKLERQRLLERDLGIAIDHDQLALAYQSLHDLDSGEVRGFEALLRWHHPQLGPVAPPEFIPGAERSGHIVPLGTWVLNEACRQAEAWRRLGLEDVKVSVNVSPLQFSHPTFLDTVLEALETHRLPPRHLELELTESVVLPGLERVAATLERLQHHGVRLAIDDFGTGYSSLAYLRDLPIDTVKIDRSFIRDLGTARKGPQFALALVEAIVSLASHLDLEVVAEGIETQAQCELVRSLGCRTGQGHYFSHAVPPGEVELRTAGERGGRAGSAGPVAH